MEGYLHGSHRIMGLILCQTSTILIPPSKSGEARRQLVGRQVCRLRGGGGVLCFMVQMIQWYSHGAGESLSPRDCCSLVSNH